MAKFGKARILALLTAASGLALMAGPLPAQDADPNAPDAGKAAAGDVIITGQRKALMTAQDRKRNASEIVDSITAVDIGALPDRSVTEALQRIPGVTIGRTNEPRDIDRLNVEGSGVMIRGLTWVRSELNGRDAFGAKGGRVLGWEDVTPELAAGIDVYKNPSAEIIEGGLGGTINLRSWMPLDFPGQKFAFSADATYGDLRKSWTPSVSGLYSNRWDTSVGQIGILVDVAHSELKSRLNALEVDPYNVHSTTTQSSYDGGATLNFSGDNAIAGSTGRTMVPTGVEYRAEDRDKTRNGYYGAIQWKPDDNLELYATYFRSDAHLINSDHFAQTSACCSATNNQSFLNGPAAGTTFKFDADGNFVSGTIIDNGGGGNGVPNSFLLNLGTRYGKEKSWTQDISGGLKWAAGHWSVSADVQHISARHSNNDFTVYNTVTATGGVGLDVSGGLPKISMADLTSTPGVFNLYAAMDHQDISTANQNTGRLDVQYDIDDSFLRSFRIGARATDRHSIQRDGGYNWALISAPWAMAQTATVSSFPEHQEIFAFDHFFRGSSSVPALWMPTQDLAKSTATTAAYLQKLWWQPNLGSNLAPYTDGTYGYYCQTCGHGTLPNWGQTPNGVYSPIPQGSLASYLPLWMSVNSATIGTGTPSQSTNFWQPFNGNYDYAPTSSTGVGTNDQREKTFALYGTARFGSDSFLGADVPFDGNIGVRVVRTELDASSFAHAPFLAIPTAISQLTNYSAAVKALFPFMDGANFTNSESNHYTDFLPSLNLRWKPADNQAIRFAASRSIVRPDFYQLQPSFNMTATLASRPATVADGVVNADTGQPYTAAELSAQAGAGNAVLYYTGVNFGFSGGNPNLKPMSANSFDLEYEYYFKPGSMLSVGIFDKEVYDYIQSDTAIVPITHNGVTANVVGTIPFNHGHGSIRGIEGQFTNWFTGWPGLLSGLGVELNGVALKSSGTRNVSGSIFDTAQVAASKLKLPLEQLSRYSFNAKLMYSKYGIDANVAYNWRSRYLLAASASNVQAPAYMEAYGQLDGSITYSLTKNVRIGVQAVNILAAKNIIDIDERDNWYYGTQGLTSKSLIYRHNWTIADRRVSFLLRGSF